MTITSFDFLVFVTIGLVLYYLLPRSWQWVELLFLSLIFYFFAATPYTILYLVISTLTAYYATMWMEMIRKSGKGSPRVVTFLALLAVSINVIIWFIVKAYDLWSIGVRFGLYFLKTPILETLLDVRFVAALGMGYYSLQIAGYILDCYWQTVERQKNPLKLFLFVCFFPQLTVGPISRYVQLEALYQKHRFQYVNVAHGAQRMLWGFLKKLVLSERLGIIVSGIAESPNTYTGFYLWIAILLYPLQMYADFSGCMDIVLGVAEMFDLRLAENFQNPFFARTIQEFWQKWHITLGTWAKDYVLYPLLKSRALSKLGKTSKRKLGKRFGKLIPTMIGMFVLWIVIGVWHGSIRHIIGVSLWYWTVLMLGEVFAPILHKLSKILGIRTESFSWHLFQSIRTYVVFAIGLVFFKMGIRGGFTMLKDALALFAGKTANPWVFFDRSMFNLGVTFVDINIIIFVTFLLVIAAVLREKYGYARNWMDRQGIAFRWMTWLFLFVFVLIFGVYGPGYNAADFIYQGF